MDPIDDDAYYNPPAEARCQAHDRVRPCHECRLAFDEFLADCAEEDAMNFMNQQAERKRP